MATDIEEKLYTPDDLLRMPDGKRFELVDGHLVENPMGVKESMVAWRLNSFLGEYALPRKLGQGFASDLGYRCFAFAPDMVRKPDGSFITQSRLTNDLLEGGFATIAPDLAVEVVSPRDPYREVEGKVAEYLRAGVRLVWVINPDTELVRVHRVDGSVAEVKRGDELSGEDILPGFVVPLALLFELPPNLPQK